MKFKIALLLTLTCLAQNVFATHAYRTTECESQLLGLRYTGNYPLGGMYEINAENSDTTFSALPLVDEASEDLKNTLENADLIFSVKSNETISKITTKSDCDFEYKEWETKKLINIIDLKDEVKQSLNLSTGNEIEFTCKETFITPLIFGCND